MTREEAITLVNNIANATKGKFIPVGEVEVTKWGTVQVRFQRTKQSLVAVKEWFKKQNAYPLVMGYGTGENAHIMYAEFKRVDNPITIIDAMTEDEARRVVGKINQLASQIGLLLIELKEREGWRALGYQSWTAFLESDELSYSRKRLYELMKAAPIVERLVTNGYGEIPTSHALALSQFPTELQVSIYETVVNHGKPVTVDRIEAQGRVLTEIVVTGGYVTTASGEQSAAVSAYNSERREQEIAKRLQPLLDTAATVARKYAQDDGDFIVLKLPSDMVQHINFTHKVRLVIYPEAA